MHRANALLAVLCCATPARTFAHGTEIHGLDDLLHAYTLDPLVLVPMALVAAGYAIGFVRVRRRSDAGRFAALLRAVAFCAGMLALTLSLVWPLDALSGAALSAHMAQHVLLTAVAAPLLAASAPLLTGLWALPRAWRRAASTFGRAARGSRGVLTLPVVAWSCYAAALWIWHMPGPYQAALGSEALHTAEHVSFLAAALLLWWAVLLSIRGAAFGLGSGIFLLFTTGLQEGLLGALLTFSGRTLYAFYDSAPGLWGITPLEDQQLAGILMWVPGGLIYLCGGLALTYLWLARLEHRAKSGVRPGVRPGGGAQAGAPSRSAVRPRLRATVSLKECRAPKCPTGACRLECVRRRSW